MRLNHRPMEEEPFVLLVFVDLRRLLPAFARISYMTHAQAYAALDREPELLHFRLPLYGVRSCTVDALSKLGSLSA